MPQSPAPSSHRLGGRCYQLLLGLSLVAIGGLFVGLMARSFLRARDMHSWPEVPCVILCSEIEQRVHDSQSPREYRHSLTYGYEWNGEARTGDLLALRGSRWSSKHDLVTKRAASYPPGLQTTCRVCPDDPNLSVLEPDSLAPGYSIWFPGLFVIAGIGISFRALHPQK